MKRVLTTVILSLLLFTAARAQDVFYTDSISGNVNTYNAQADSLRALTNELTQLTSKLKAAEEESEKEKHYANVWNRKKYLKLGFGTPSIKRTDGEEMSWDTQVSLFLQFGKTTYFHSKPLWDMVKIGLDWSFLDFSYSKLKLKTAQSLENSASTSGSNSTGGFDDIESDDPNISIGSLASQFGINLGMHKFEYGWHFGPKISVNPWNDLIVSAYFHVMPTVSGILENDNFSFGWGIGMAAGVSVAYKVISVGFEGLWCSTKYTQVDFDEEESDYGNLFNTKSFKLKQTAPRLYVELRF